MATDNVTSIRPGSEPPPPTTPKKRTRHAKPGLVLAASGEDEGFTTLDVLNGLHGVCEVLDLKGDDNDVDDAELATAAHVLASILQSRVDS